MITWFDNRWESRIFGKTIIAIESDKIQIRTQKKKKGENVKKCK